MKESSADKVREAFHPNAKVVGHLHGDFLEMSTEAVSYKHLTLPTTMWV